MKVCANANSPKKVDEFKLGHDKSPRLMGVVRIAIDPFFQGGIKSLNKGRLYKLYSNHIIVSLYISYIVTIDPSLKGAYY